MYAFQGSRPRVVSIYSKAVSPLGFHGLPGDIFVQREGFTFVFPVVTCLVISALLTLVLKQAYPE